LDPHLDTHQLSDLTGVAQGLNPRKQSEGPRKGFRILEVLWTRDQVNPRGNPETDQNRPLVETRGRDRESSAYRKSRDQGFETL
jgi:hypothetical protein